MQYERKAISQLHNTSQYCEILSNNTTTEKLSYPNCYFTIHNSKPVINE
jgi:hypothetical protein